MLMKVNMADINILVKDARALEVGLEGEVCEATVELVGNEK